MRPERHMPPLPVHVHPCGRSPTPDQQLWPLPPPRETSLRGPHHHRGTADEFQKPCPVHHARTPEFERWRHGAGHRWGFQPQIATELVLRTRRPTRLPGGGLVHLASAQNSRLCCSNAHRSESLVRQLRPTQPFSRQLSRPRRRDIGPEKVRSLSPLPSALQLAGPRK